MPSRPIPHVGMPVRVQLLGRLEEGEVQEVRDGGRVLVVNGRSFSLRALTGQWVADGEPYYGPRLLLGRPQGDEPGPDPPR